MPTASQEQKKKQICEYKDQIDTLIHQQYHLQAQRFGLSLEQYHLLIELDELMLDVPAEDTGLSIGGIARHVGNAQNTISERLTRLEDKGYIQRVRDPKDRRVNRVVITQEGQNLIQAISAEASGQALMEALDSLDDGELDHFLTMLKKIASVLDKGKSDGL